jgi:hypothetical protein
MITKRKMSVSQAPPRKHQKRSATTTTTKNRATSMTSTWSGMLRSTIIMTVTLFCAGQAAAEGLKNMNPNHENGFIIKKEQVVKKASAKTRILNSRRSFLC